MTIEVAHVKGTGRGGKSDGVAIVVSNTLVKWLDMS